MPIILNMAMAAYLRQPESTLLSCLYNEGQFIVTLEEKHVNQWKQVSDRMGLIQIKCGPQSKSMSMNYFLNSQ